MVEKYKIIHDRDACIGCGACAAADPNYWDMADDGKAILKENNNNEKTLEENYDTNHEAAESCPVNCIHIFEIKEDNSEEKII